MKTLTEMMLRHGAVNGHFQLGTDRLKSERHFRREARRCQARIRAKYGFVEKYTPVITGKGSNAKLDHATQHSVGLTLQPYVTRLGPRLTVNCCPNATPGCIAGCVIKHAGRVQFDKRIDLARRAKTEFFARYPCEACFLYGWELADQVDKHGPLLNRPNVGSDAEWEKILPSLTSGKVFGEDVWSYGYTKLTDVLKTDGYLDAAYRVAYSWNENSAAYDVANFLDAGGSVAMVTSRKKGEPPRGAWIARRSWPVVDADLTDEWIFQRGVIGDLSAKGKGRKLIGKSAFVVQTGATS